MVSTLIHKLILLLDFFAKNYYHSADVAHTMHPQTK